MSERQRICCAAFGVVLLLGLFDPSSQAQFKVTDNFNRADGAVGLDWSNWGNGAQISGNELETFGQTSVAGGIQRTLGVTFPLSFSFDFSTAAPSDGGWFIAFNAQTAVGGNLSLFTGEIGFYEPSGSREVCYNYQTSSGPSQDCANLVKGQRDFTAQAVITGTVNSDFSATFKIKYNDGLKPASVTVKTAAPVGAINSPQGNILFFGNCNATSGPHIFDNFSLTLD